MVLPSREPLRKGLIAAHRQSYTEVRGHEGFRHWLLIFVG